MKIKDVAKLTGITVRTLHYYDEIGLLAPSEITDAGYRLYDDSCLERLSQIMFFKELDFSLSDIKQILSSPSFDRKKALLNQKDLLLKKKERLDGLIELVDRRLSGGNNMSFKEFDSSAYDNARTEYAEEAKEKYGHTESFKEFKKKSKDYSNNDWNNINEGYEAIFSQIADTMDCGADSEKTQSLIKKWQDFITEHLYKCTDEILSGLGQMYIGDERFKENIDKIKPGLAQYIAKAIEIYVS